MASNLVSTRYKYLLNPLQSTTLDRIDRTTGTMLDCLQQPATMDIPDLLPCLFCGATDDDDLRRVIDGEWENSWIECDKCGAQGPHVTMQRLPIDNISTNDFIKAKNLADGEASAAAAAAWNHRST